MLFFGGEGISSITDGVQSTNSILGDLGYVSSSPKKLLLSDSFWQVVWQLAEYYHTSYHTWEVGEIPMPHSLYIGIQYVLGNSTCCFETKVVFPLFGELIACFGF